MCDKAKDILNNVEKYSEDLSLLEWAYERQNFTQKYCGDTCGNPDHHLDPSVAIDLKDGIQDSSGNPILLFKNPTQLLQSSYLNQYFELCTYAHQGHLPVSGGILDQDLEFLEFYTIFIRWKNIRKIEARSNNEQ